jgi:hypothetical protein
MKGQQRVTKGIDIATDQDLKWLNNGFDEEAMARLDAAYLDKAKHASPTPPHWRFPDEEDAGGRGAGGA